MHSPPFRKKSRKRRKRGGSSERACEFYHALRQQEKEKEKVTTTGREEPRMSKRGREKSYFVRRRYSTIFISESATCPGQENFLLFSSAFTYTVKSLLQGGIHSRLAHRPTRRQNGNGEKIRVADARARRANDRKVASCSDISGTFQILS